MKDDKLKGLVKDAMSAGCIFRMNDTYWMYENSECLDIFKEAGHDINPMQIDNCVLIDDIVKEILKEDDEK